MKYFPLKTRKNRLTKRIGHSEATNSYHMLESRRLLACDLVGTSGDDVITIDMGGETIFVSINGDEFQCPHEDLGIDALDGDDSIVITDSPDDERVELRSNSVVVDGAFRLEITNAEVHEVKSGGGNDSVFLYTTQINEDLFIGQNHTLLRGQKSEIRTFGYAHINAFAVHVPSSVFFNDSELDDLFVGGKSYSGMEYGNGVRVDTYGYTTAFSTSNAGGSDRAIFAGSDSDDNLFANERVSRMSDGTHKDATYTVRAEGFEIVTAIKSPGNDSATILETNADDVFYGTPELANFKFRNRTQINVNSFARVSVIGNPNQVDNDLAYIFGGDGDNQMFANEDSMIFLGDEFSFYLRAVEIHDVRGEGGNNRAVLFDLAGDAKVGAGPQSVRMNRDGDQGYSINGRGFQNTTVNSLATGENFALLFGSRTARNEFFGHVDSSRLVSSDFSIQVNNFKFVEAVGINNNDAAFLTGTTADETMRVERDAVGMRSDGISVQARRFPNTYINGRGGADKATIADAPQPEIMSIRPNFASLEVGQDRFFSFSNVREFDFIHSFNRDREGDDVVFLNDTTGDDVLRGSGDVIRFVGDGLIVTMQQMPKIFATASAGGINTWAVGDFIGNTDLRRIGNWVDATD